jgi:hypothetical protein
MVKEVDAFIQGCVDQSGYFLIGHAGDPHTSQRDFRRVHVCIGDFDIFHLNAFLG